MHHPDDDPHERSGGDTREQDRFLPVANIARIMKTVLPPNAKIGKDAKETIQECVSEFISFITSEASDKCVQEKRKTINGDDILWAMGTLGFDPYLNPLKIYLSKYREVAKSDKPEKKVKGSGSDVGIESVSPYTAPPPPTMTSSMLSSSLHHHTTTASSNTSSYHHSHQSGPSYLVSGGDTTSNVSSLLSSSTYNTKKRDSTSLYYTPGSYAAMAAGLPLNTTSTHNTSNTTNTLNTTTSTSSHHHTFSTGTSLKSDKTSEINYSAYATSSGNVNNGKKSKY